MDIPNFIGMKYQKAQEILSRDFSNLKVINTRYTADTIKKERKTHRITEERIVRQRLLPSNELELIVSDFLIPPETNT